MADVGETRRDLVTVMHQDQLSLRTTSENYARAINKIFFHINLVC